MASTAPLPSSSAAAAAANPSTSNTANSNAQALETAHEDMIHDAQLDYYGRRLATASSDRTIRVFHVDPTTGMALSSSNANANATSSLPPASHSHHKASSGSEGGAVAVLRGHTGPVWGVAWSHPKFGPVLASCSYDSRVFVWKEGGVASSNSNSAEGFGGMGRTTGVKTTREGSSSADWVINKEHTLHTASVNSIAWAPHELGPILACASSDGKVSVLSFGNDGSFTYEIFTADAMGVNAVSWAPAIVPGSLSVPHASAGAGAGANTGAGGGTGAGQGGQGTPNGGANGTGNNNSPGTVVYQKKLASAGCDQKVRIWSYKDNNAQPELEEELSGHDDWVRDVAWAPNIGLPGEYIASASQDKTVLIHHRAHPTSSWISTPLLPNGPNNPDPHFPDAVWRVSWSLAGNVLAVSCGDGKVSLWKEIIGGNGWECVSEMAS